MNIRMAAVAAVVGSSWLAGCSSQVDSQYRGEPLAVISGAVSSAEVGIDGLVPVLGWYNFAEAEGDEDGDAQPVLLQKAEVEGEFPNRFTVRVYDLPPEGALIAQAGEPKTGLAMIFAADPGADWDERFGDRDDWPRWLAGAAENYMVMYVDGRTLPDGVAARRLGKQLDKGYHLIAVRELNASERNERVVCQEGAGLRAIDAYNRAHGTEYASSADVPEDQYEELAVFEDAENADCGGKLHMRVIESGLDNPIELRIGADLQFIDWT